MRQFTVTMFLATLVAAPVAAQSGNPWHFDLGLRVSSLQEVNASDSYDAVFGGDAITLPGIQLELRPIPRFLVSLTVERGEVDGERVIPTDPPIGTGIDETLTYMPAHLSGAYVFAPESQLHGFLGAGLTWLDWEDESAGDSASGTDLGYHAVGGIRWSTLLQRFAWGGDVRYSSVPDAVGEAGITELFDEDDLGGIAVGIHLLWRVR